jgi:hypothetical protein
MSILNLTVFRVFRKKPQFSAVSYFYTLVFVEDLFQGRDDGPSIE